MARNIVSVDANLVAEARQLGLNVEAICEAAIREAIRAERVAKGLDESGGHEGVWTSGE